MSSVAFSRPLPSRVVLTALVFSKPVWSMVRFRKVELSRLAAGVVLPSRAALRLSCPSLSAADCGMPGTRREEGARARGSIPPDDDPAGAGAPAMGVERGALAIAISAAPRRVPFSKGE